MRFYSRIGEEYSLVSDYEKELFSLFNYPPALELFKKSKDYVLLEWHI